MGQVLLAFDPGMISNRVFGMYRLALVLISFGHQLAV
jgi:hypothetical protein